MDPRPVKPPIPERMGMPPTMQQITEKMRTGMAEFRRTAVCQVIYFLIMLVRADQVTWSVIEAGGVMRESS